MRRVAGVRAELGESPVWDEQKGVLYFVDITRGRIHVLLQNGKTETVYESVARIGALALSDKGNLIFTEDARVAMLDLQAGEVSHISPAIHDDTGCRFNDGACDPQGRFITGLMHEGPDRSPGELYRFGCSGDAYVIQQGIALPNGLAWSDDGNTLYFVDSIACSIFQAAYNAYGMPEQIRLFVKTPTGLGRPDGIALDKEGGLWVCQFNGGCLLRYDRNGCLSERVVMPVPRPTSCCFGGEGLGTLFITTARFAMTVPELIQYPNAGDLYAINPGISGNSRYRFKECQ
ncbi:MULTISPECIES: SMP-30/gluconolactonase/LRE family protein [unclassified Enterobacter]|uniref:SMP-30/gluconolactonase/LRE family protein n=1 Tax=unclassified Enterobacter TaxID=2608935 RepID=UPI0021A8CE03|nr:MULTISPECIES: SMP-30/gluconolactonase/LRE family protein [unclassified Enterobacter]